MMVIEAGEYPLWFELGGEGPRRINSPGEAALVPFAPWPLARHVRGFLPSGDGFTAAVNRDGFLRVKPWDEGAGAAEAADWKTGLYRAAVPYWNEYSAASLFRFKGRASVLLYRDDFFIENSLPPPEPRVFTLDEDKMEPLSLELPAFADFPAAGGWDVDALWSGNDEGSAADGTLRWYYRILRKNAERPEIHYFRSAGLSQKGEQVSLGDFRNSGRNEHISAAPDLLQSLLASDSFLSAGIRGGAVSTVSKDFPYPRRFSLPSQAAESGTAPDLLAYCRDNAALVLSPEGAGFAAVSAAASFSIRRFSLPALPDNFVYTGLSLCGNTLFASWEEQRDFNIGAAGLLVIKAEL
jgi:hypothetical protein